MHSAVESIIEVVVTDLGQGRENITIEDLYHEIILRITEENNLRDANSQISRPSMTTVWRRYNKLDPFERYPKRESKSASKQRATQYGKADHPDYPLSRVEIDHTQLDIIMEGVEVRPYLTWCLDVATRIILGYSVGFEPPSYLAVMECLYHAILPKVNVKERFGTSGDYLGYGCPSVLVTDNGKEFIGRDLEDACDCLNIKLHQVPIKAPNFKGTIEREFRTLNEGLIHKLPGTTFSNVEQRGNYDSIKNAALSLDSLEKLINIFIVDIYSQRFHRGLGGIPARVWEQKTATTGFFPRLPNSREELLVLLGRVDQRSIHAYGIEFEKLISVNHRMR